MDSYVIEGYVHMDWLMCLYFIIVIKLSVWNLKVFKSFFKKKKALFYLS